MENSNKKAINLLLDSICELFLRLRNQLFLMKNGMFRWNKERKRTFSGKLFCLLDVIIDNRRFKFFCDGFEIDQDNELLVDNLSLFEIFDRNVEEFKITVSTFSGRRLNAYDALLMEIAKYTQGDSYQKVLFMHKKVRKYIDMLLPEQKTCIIEGRKTPIHILCLSYGVVRVAELLFATDRFLYYWTEDDAFIMLNADGKLLSDNSFAEDGYYGSLEAVANGEEVATYFAESYEEEIREQIRFAGLQMEVL